MSDAKTSLLFLLEAFSRAYKFLAWATSIFVVIGILGCIWEGTRGHWEAVTSYLSSGGTLVIAALRFGIWRIICQNILELLRSRLVRAQTLSVLAKAFLGSFALDVVRFVFIAAVQPQRVDWSDVHLPSWSGNVPLFLLNSFTFFFKLSAIGDGFLTPTTYGLSSLFIGLFVKAWASQKNEFS